LYSDPMIRDRHDAPPLVPGSAIRFKWPQPFDSDVEKVRTGVQERGRGLFVLRAPFGEAKCLVEAYYPHEITANYAESVLDPLRFADMRQGRLIVVGNPRFRETMKVGEGVGSFRVLGPKGVTPTLLEEVRRNNRNARSHLKRNANPMYAKQELNDIIHQREQEAFDRWEDFYADAWKQTVKFALPEKRTNHFVPGGIA